MIAPRVILATGLVDVLPDIENPPAFYGTSVFHCPSCDGATVDDRRVVVLSWGNRAEGFTRELRTWTRRLTLVTHGHDIDAGTRTRLERDNGRLYTGNPRAIPLTAHALITLEVGPPWTPPTTRFSWPAGT